MNGDYSSDHARVVVEEKIKAKKTAKIRCFFDLMVD